jgi:hypothetical protein
MSGKKSEAFTKGMWILIKRYPEYIEVCPVCNNIIFSRVGDRKHIKELKTTAIEIEMMVEGIYFSFYCTKCHYTMRGMKYTLYMEDLLKKIESYFEKTDIKQQSYKDFENYIDKCNEKLRIDWSDPSMTVCLRNKSIEYDLSLSEIAKKYNCHTKMTKNEQKALNFRKMVKSRSMF